MFGGACGHSHPPPRDKKDTDYIWYQVRRAYPTFISRLPFCSRWDIFKMVGWWGRCVATVGTNLTEKEARAMMTLLGEEWNGG